MEETIERLKIEIVSDTKNASTDIKKLASSFRMLKKATEDISTLKSVYNTLKKIDALSFKNPIKGLNSIVTAFKAINAKKLSTPIIEEKPADLTPKTGSTTMTNSAMVSSDIESNKIDLEQFKKLGEMFNFDSSFIDKLSTGKVVADELLKSFKANGDELQRERQQIEDLTARINELPKVKNIFGEDTLSSEATKLSGIRDQLLSILHAKEEVANNANNIMSNLNSSILANDTAEATTQLQNLQNELSKLSKYNSSFDSLGNSANSMIEKLNKGTSKVSKFVASLGRISLYRAIRSILKSFTEGFQDLAQFDSIFNESMSEIKSNIMYIRNSLIAMVAPIIEVLTPVFTALTNVVVACIEKLTIMFNVLAGNTTYTKATKTVEDYAEALRRAQSQSTGFDELNVLKSDTTSADEMFTTAEIDTSQINEAIALATTLGTILVGLSVVKIITGVTELITLFKKVKTSLVAIKALLATGGIKGLLAHIGPILLGIAGTVMIVYGFVDGIINGFNWQNVLIILGGIVALCVAIGLSIGWIPALIVAIIAVVALLVAVVIQYWEDIKAFFVKIWTAISDFFVGIWNGIVSVWQNVTSWFVNLFTSAWEGIKTAWSAVTGFFSNIWTSIKTGFVNAINGVISGFESFINFFVKGINTIIKGINSIRINIPDWLGGGHIGFNLAYISEVKLGRISGYETGGFPRSGELYMARENGISEMVGRFGSRATVANNDQIIEGIKRGVYEAMMESKSDDDNGNIIIQVVDRSGRVQSEQIISSAERRNRRDGKKVIAVGV